METISTIEIFILLTIFVIIYDLYRIYSFHLPHYKQGVNLCSGSSPYPGRDEFPSNYKMNYKTDEIVYKFLSPDHMVFRYNYESGIIKNLIPIKGVGELKDGEIHLTSRIGLLTPVSIVLLVCANLLYLDRIHDPQVIFGSVITIILVVSYLYYCRSAAYKLPRIVADKIDESLLH